MATKEELTAKLMAIGFSETDSEALADSITSRSSVSWVNTDEVTNGMLEKLGDFIKENSLKVKVSVQEVPNRNKYIWDVEY
jgi:hypothetical protein